MKAQTAHEQHDKRIAVSAKRLSGVGFLRVAEHEILGMDAKRDDGHLRKHEPRDAQSRLQVVDLSLQNPLHVVANRRAGADQSIPKLNGCCDQFGNCAHCQVAAGGMSDPAKAPCGVAISACSHTTVPSMLTDAGAWVVHRSRLRQRGEARLVDDLQRLAAAGSLDGGGQVAGMVWLFDLRPELGGFAVSQITAKKRFTGCVAAHQLGAAGGVSLRVVVDGSCHDGAGSMLTLQIFGFVL